MRANRWTWEDRVLLAMLWACKLGFGVLMALIVWAGFVR